MCRALDGAGSDCPPAGTRLKSESPGAILADVKISIGPHARRSLETVIWALLKRVEALIADNKINVDCFHIRLIAALEKRRRD